MGASRCRSLDDFLLFLWLFPERGGNGGKLGTGLFLELPSLCTSQASLTSVPSSVLENDFKPCGVKQLGRKRMATGTVWRRGAVSKFENTCSG